MRPHNLSIQRGHATVSAPLPLIVPHLFTDLSTLDRSKLANVLFARALQQRFSAAGSSAVAMSVNPGDVATETVLGFVRQWPLLGGIAASCVKALLLTPAQGAHTPLFAAASRTVRTDKAYAGAYLVPYGKMEKIVGDAASAQLAENLWESSDRIVDSVLSRPS